MVCLQDSAALAPARTSTDKATTFTTLDFLRLRLGVATSVSRGLFDGEG